MVETQPKGFITEESAKKYALELAASGVNPQLTSAEAERLIDFLVTFSHGTAKYLERPDSSFSKALPEFIIELNKMGYSNKIIQQMIGKTMARLRGLPTFPIFED